LQELHREFVTQLRSHRYVNNDNEAGHVMNALTPLLRLEDSLVSKILDENHALCTAAGALHFLDMLLGLRALHSGALFTLLALLGQRV
jgi:hypothetical protein